MGVGKQYGESPEGIAGTKSGKTVYLDGMYRVLFASWMVRFL